MISQADLLVQVHCDTVVSTGAGLTAMAMLTQHCPALKHLGSLAPGAPPQHQTGRRACYCVCCLRVSPFRGVSHRSEVAILWHPAWRMGAAESSQGAS